MNDPIHERLIAAGWKSSPPYVPNSPENRYILEFSDLELSDEWSPSIMRQTILDRRAALDAQLVADAQVAKALEDAGQKITRCGDIDEENPCTVYDEPIIFTHCRIALLGTDSESGKGRVYCKECFHD